MQTHYELFIFGAVLCAAGFIVCIVLGLSGPRNQLSRYTVGGSVLAVAALIFCAFGFYNKGQVNKTPPNLSNYNCNQVTTLYVAGSASYTEAAEAIAKNQRNLDCTGGYNIQYSWQKPVFHKVK